MAKKSRTSNKKSNDSQKKLLALVLIILFIGLGVFLVVSSFAAKGGKGKPGSGTTIYPSPYEIQVTPSTASITGTSGYGTSVNIAVADPITHEVLIPPPEVVNTKADCFDSKGSLYADVLNKSLTYTGQVSITVGQGFQNYSYCNIYLQLQRNGSLVRTDAVAKLTITP